MFEPANRDLAEDRIDIHCDAAAIQSLGGEQRGPGMREMVGHPIALAQGQKLYRSSYVRQH